MFESPFNREYELSELVIFVSDKISAEDVSLDTYISTDNMLVDRGGVEPATKLPSASNFNHYKIRDTLFSNIRTYFRKVWLADFEGGASPDVIIFRSKNSEILDSVYLYFLLSNEDFVNYTVLTAKGAKMPRGDKAAIMQYRFYLPDIAEQRKVGNDLLTINDKIELNRQTNQTLEQIAQAIFKSWFVDFEPVKAKIHAKQTWAENIATKNGESNDKAEADFIERAAMRAISGKTDTQLEQLSPDVQQQLKTTAALFPDTLVDSELGDIPEGWEISCIDDVCDFQNGYAFKSKEMSKNPENAYKVFKMGGIKKGGGLNKSSTKDYYEKVKCEKLGRYLIKKGDLLMCMTDMKNNVALLGHTALMDVNDEYILNQRVGLLRSKNVVKANYPFLYILTNSEYFIADLRSRANSGVQVNLSTKEIKETKYTLPTEGVHIAFNQVVEKAQEQIFSLEAEQIYLSELRDTLLPKLLSGELNINKKNVEVP